MQAVHPFPQKKIKWQNRIEWLFWLKIQSQSKGIKHDNIYMYVLGYRFLGRPLSFFS